MINAQGSLRLGFAGTPEFALPALEALLGSRHAVAAVFTQPDRPAGRGRTLRASAVKRRALERGLPVHQPSSFKSPEALAALRALELEALVVIAYGLILPAAALDLPRQGCFNIHASLLPRWRGAAPIQRTLLAGDAWTGVTIMRMAAGLDTGPLLMARRVRIQERETGGTLHDKLADLGGELIVEALDAVARGGATLEPQPPHGVTYAAKIDKGEALIDWREDAAAVLRRVRAFNPWPIAETRLAGAQLRIWEAELAPSPRTDTPPRDLEVPPRQADAPPPGTVIAASGEGIDVACGGGALRVLKLQLAGRKQLSAAQFLQGQRLFGERLDFTSGSQP